MHDSPALEIAEQLQDALRRLTQLEGQYHALEHTLLELVKQQEAMATRVAEIPVAPWKYLAIRPHRWRRQLFVRGRNLTVGHLVMTMRANRLSPEQAAEELDLPIEAIREAQAYFDQNREIIAQEAAEERRALTDGGFGRAFAPVS
jgi:uncharacterized protein (DUF433 family)